VPEEQAGQVLEQRHRNFHHGIRHCNHHHGIHRHSRGNDRGNDH
jgi:hypothetical protein